MKRKNDNTVLIIDDEKSIRSTLSLFLSDEGYSSNAFELPSEALAAQAENKYELALVDVNLPEMDGFKLAEKLLENDPNLTVVFITGFDSFNDVVQAIRLGAYDYLKKPLMPGELTLALERFEERKTFRKKIRQAEQLNTMLVQNIPVMLLTFDSDLNITFANRTSRNMLGFTPEECTAEGWLFSRMTENDCDKFGNSFRDAVKKAKPFSEIIKIRHREGHFVYALFQSLPLVPDTPDSNRMRCAVTDITDRILLEKKMVLDEKLKTMGTITAEVAHEIRNPLMSIGGFARRLQNRFPSLAEAEIIVRESYRLEKILNRINNYLSPVKFQRVECNAVSILRECLELLEPEIQDRKVHCRSILDEGLPPVYADPDLLRQVFVNMVLGAIRNMHPGSELKISTESSEEKLKIRFSSPYPPDNPIDPEKVFTPFEDGGQSIGMPLTYRLIKNMDGELNFLTEDSNAVFIMDIPMGNAQPENPVDEISQAFNCMPSNPAGSLENLLQREWLRSAREMKPLGIISLEIENVDIITADMSDEEQANLFNALYSSLQDILKRAADFLSSCGSRTFVAVLPGTDRDGVESVAHQMTKSIRNTTAELTGLPHHAIVIQTGTAVEVPTPEQMPEDLIDKAVYNMRTGK